MEGKHKFLHGTLEATIFHATPYKPSFPFNCMSTGKPTYVTIKIDKQKVASTSQEIDRVWNQTLQILCAHSPDSTITISLKTKCSNLGKFCIPAHQILTEASLINGFFPLCMENGKPDQQVKLRFMLWFKPAELEPTWSNLLNSGEFKGLKNATFLQRSNCNVTLYQDAHHHSTFHPQGNIDETPRKLWEDVYKAIEDAKYLIYIAGWSFNPNLVLVRDFQTDIPHARGVELGELLKRKAEEGVSVRIMVWDDETSLPIIKNTGVMRTQDEDAYAYFKHTKVICKLCPRLHNKFPTMFAHHQKTITMDSRGQSSNREIISFIGGLDLCGGRYDTEEHSLFRTLNTEYHSQDFYQINLPGASLRKGGPREPWHDVHACISGEAARDVMTNFEQRWTKQCDPSLLVPLNTITELSRQPISATTLTKHNWKVQVFRSIDHVSAHSNFRVERSIHEAYVEAIRRAERFIYIENQYFIGGCRLWEKNQQCGCTNLIPVEIALKIASKIKTKERFAVYILIPLWPEGVPESETVQDILHWTRETMKMMYKLVGEALQEIGERGHPKDYLNFFCLVNREEKRQGEFIPPSSPHCATQYWNAQTHRRFMIYIHSKLMIVDDTYMLIGSANVNQRSMDGQRDTEIAMGCYQMDDENRKISQGEVHRYRSSLWYEHTQRAEDIFHSPESLECVQKFNSIGVQMWELYQGEKVVDMDGVHLAAYPVSVREDGLVEDLVANNGCFPDTKAPVRGRRSKVLPSTCTT